MNVYASEDEQVEALKKWWQANGRSIVVGVVIGLSGVLGWQSWQNYINKQGQAASAEYEAVLQAQADLTSEVALRRGQQLQATYERSPYAILNALELAKIKADSKDWANAEKHLRWALAHAKLEGLQHIIRLRLGRVLLASDQSQTALNIVNALKVEEMGDFAGAYEVLKGDVYLALDNKNEARQAYQRAFAAGMNNDWLRLKLDDLAVES